MVVAMSSSEPTRKSHSAPRLSTFSSLDVAKVVQVAPIRVYEVATFYSMVNRTKVLNLASNKSDIERRVHASIDKFAGSGLSTNCKEKAVKTWNLN
ncbi:hypothetical protein Syun_012156 [Stephania yunnanensis]|uniref:Uncharacterized protein n=1 Tax=Stephania yunnanensis TaxID=152371 RepID=A0AAP0JZ46_9MAGN